MNGIAPVPGNFTYPTRNFATLGPFFLFRPTQLRVDRELQPLQLKLPAYRYADRTVSSRRMVLRGPGVQSLRILSSRLRAFPADCPHLKDYHCRFCGEYPR